MKKVSYYRKQAFDQMLEDSSVAMPLSEISRIAEGDDDLYAMPFGCVIDQQGQVHILHVYATHGVIAAILHPETATAFGAPQPTMVGRDSLPVMAYQEFELSMGYRLPLIRISTRFDINISHGRGEFWPNAAQQAALKKFLKANDALEEKVNAEIAYGVRGNDFLQTLFLGEQNAEAVKIRDEETNDDAFDVKELL